MSRTCRIGFVSLLLLGLAGCGENVKDPTGKYGDCTVSYNGRARWAFTFPNRQAFHAAIDKFIDENPKFDVGGVFAYQR